jgi:hypothetical protein
MQMSDRAAIKNKIVMQHTHKQQSNQDAHLFLMTTSGEELWLSTPDDAAATDGTESEADDMSAKNEDEKEEGWAALRWVAACRSRM